MGKGKSRSKAKVKIVTHVRPKTSSGKGGLMFAQLAAVRRQQINANKNHG